jgi:hypothetical protein
VFYIRKRHLSSPVPEKVSIPLSPLKIYSESIGKCSSTQRVISNGKILGCARSRRGSQKHPIFSNIPSADRWPSFMDPPGEYRSGFSGFGQQQAAFIQGESSAEFLRQQIWSVLQGA